MGVQSRVEDAELLKPWELKRSEFKQKKKLTGNRDKSTLAAMQAFSKQLTSLPPAAQSTPQAGQEEKGASASAETGPEVATVYPPHLINLKAMAGLGIWCEVSKRPGFPSEGLAHMITWFCVVLRGHDDLVTTEGMANCCRGTMGR